MKKLLTFLSGLVMFNTPISVVGCFNSETRDRNKISLALFKNELTLIPVFSGDNFVKTVTEQVFQTAIYWSLETNEYRGDIASNELKFLYYNKDLTPITWTDLSWEPIFDYAENILKTLPEHEIMAYLAVLNPTFYFSPRHFTISKTSEQVIIKALETSERYRGENIINF